MTTPSPLEEKIDGVLDAIVSHAQATGYFSGVNASEPKSTPVTEMTCAIWLQRIRPIPARSGLDRTSGLVIFNCRLYIGMFTEPQDYIDPRMTKATSALMAAYSSKFTFGGLISNVDLLGAHGFPLEGMAGYITIGTTKFRVMTITIPCVMNDLFTQAP